jgi:hypothetical protein
MKKIFVGLFLLLFSIRIAFAASISSKDAQLIAENFYSAQIANSKVSFGVANLNEFNFEGEATMYIFSFTPNGFVIVSADDMATPIIGYSLTNSFGDGLSNPSLVSRLNFYSKQIKEGKLQKSQDAEVKAEWDALKTGKAQNILAAGTPLLTTTWNQGTANSPTYNLLCPSYTYTGCVATAMAQIMNYHEWPTSGRGWYKYVPAGNPDYGVQYADFSSTTYDWSNMPNSLSTSSSDLEKSAVSTLMYHAGVSVSMNYAADGSGAYSIDVMYALTNYFKYDPTTINTYTFNASNTTNWVTMVKSEIDNGRPIYYSGSSAADGGHAWVCDGYDASNRLHINWGWGGSANGYFACTAMSPSGMNFTENNSIITGIKPDNASQSILWHKQNTGFTNAYRLINGISAVNDRVAWAVASDGNGSAKVKDFTRTIDGGSTWESKTINATGTIDYSAAMISAVSEKKAWVALFYVSADGSSTSGKIVNTDNGGLTWQIQSTASFSAPAGFPNVIHFWDENNGLCMGDPNDGYFEIYTTTNGGNNWVRVPSNNIPAVTTGEAGTVGSAAIFGNTVWFATNKGRIFKSTNNGVNWLAYQTPITNTSFAISFKDDNFGIIQRRNSGGDSSPITAWKTADGGQNWTQLISTGKFYTNSFMFIPGSSLLISTGSNLDAMDQGVSYSTDNGATFTNYASYYKNYPFFALGAASTNSIWAGSYNYNRYYGGIWHLGNIALSIDFNASKSVGYQNDSTVVFTQYSYGSPETWSWNFGDGASPQTLTGAGPHTVKYLTMGDKTVTCTITKGTEEVILVKQNLLTITWPVGVETSNLDQKYSVYPNPATTIIKINGYMNGPVKIYSTAGALVMDVESLPADGSLNISKLSGGMYIIKIQSTDGKVISKKLTIVR